MKFSVKTFAPAWGASVMGTAVISVIFFALGKNPAWDQTAVLGSRIFLVVALALAIPVLGITAWKWIRYPQVIKAELAHPTKGAMSVTFAGGFLVLAVALGRAGIDFFGADVAVPIAYAFTLIGGTLSLIIGLIFLASIFAKGDTPAGMITGAWFIPPVVTIVVPLALGPLMTQPSRLSHELFWISWAFLGIGSMLYMAIVAVLIYRSVTRPLPPPALAPTLVIGMGPAGLIGLNLLVLAEAAERIGVDWPTLKDIASYGGVLFWGFGLWWGIASVLVMAMGYGKIPFALSWWGFTFPLGAWVSGGLNIGYAIDSYTIVWISVFGFIVLLAIWAIVSFRTLEGVLDGSIWEG